MSDDLEQPSAEEVAAARLRAGLTQSAAADLARCSRRAWVYFETGGREIDLARWELFLAKIGERKIKAIRKAKR